MDQIKENSSNITTENLQNISIDDIDDIDDNNSSNIIFEDITEYKEYKILSIDVGVIHFGISFSILNEDFTLKEIVYVDNIDITKYKHKKCPLDKCKLYHTKTFYDWIEHTIQENIEYFEGSDMIIIEKQPPQGFVVVEQLIFSKYRKKTTLISPQSVHKFLNFFDLDYDKRKELSIKIGDKYLSKELIERTKTFDRRHDISDSICMLLYFINKKQIEYKKNKSYNMLYRDMKGMNAIEKLESFRYYKSIKVFK
jgi:hypothetical protein